jgi:hypothetical protein
VEDHDDDIFDNGGTPASPIVDPELQPVELTEVEAIEPEIAQNELDELGRWHGLSMKLRNTPTHVAPPALPVRAAAPPPPSPAPPALGDAGLRRLHNIVLALTMGDSDEGE